jgi:hypothetical protein
MRPIRDQMASRAVNNLQWLLRARRGMLLNIPFAYLVKIARTRFIPVTYRFFAAPSHF